MGPDVGSPARTPQTDPLLLFVNSTRASPLYTLSLHDALPISYSGGRRDDEDRLSEPIRIALPDRLIDRKSTRLNSSHTVISYAVFCLKKKRPRDRMPDRQRGRPRRTHGQSKRPTRGESRRGRR